MMRRQGLSGHLGQGKATVTTWYCRQAIFDPGMAPALPGQSRDWAAAGSMRVERTVNREPISNGLSYPIPDLRANAFCAKQEIAGDMHWCQARFSPLPGQIGGRGGRIGLQSAVPLASSPAACQPSQG